MKESENTILPDHQDRLEEQFDYINYLISNDKLNEAAELLLELHYADLADFLDNSNRKIYYLILPVILERLNPEVLVSLGDSNKQRVIEAIGVAECAKLIEKLDIEDSIEVIDALDVQLKEALLSKLKPSKYQQILEGFKYPENTAGRVLEKNFVSFEQEWTVGQAIDFIRNNTSAKDFHAAIIVDKKYKPIGTILLSTLLKSNVNNNISEVMNREFKISDTYTELDELAFIFKQYALTIVPVTNKKGKLVGTISIDNMLYIVEEQTENEFMYLGGIYNRDIFYNLYATAKHRFPWLFVNLITACMTSLIIDQFSGTIASLITIATIMPIVASMGGNAGTQAMTVTVRAIASREITSSNSIKVLYKEMLTCALNGISLSLIGSILTYILFADYKLSIVFASAVIINFTVAGCLGSGIPILLNNMDIDPAAASGVFLTAFTDAIGFFSFLGLAFCFLV